MMLLESLNTPLTDHAKSQNNAGSWSKCPQKLMQVHKILDQGSK